MAKFVVILALAAIALTASPAHAVTKVCMAVQLYFLISPNTFPKCRTPPAVNLPPRGIDGYAPPCLVAEDVAGIVQARWRHLPRVVWAKGARWNGGHWRVTYCFKKRVMADT